MEKEEKNYTGIIPGQEEGSIITAESHVETEDTELAQALFNTAKERLLDVNNWQHVAGELLARFQLTDAAGREVPSPVQEGYRFKLDIPGPGTEAGEGYDWVEVEAVETFDTADIESVAIRVRPASNPQTPEEEVAHFYSDESTSTFTVTREKNKVTAAVYDRNIKPNTDSERLGDKLRNTLAGAVGIGIFSKVQWKNLTDGLIQAEAT
ncbi:hypothetical protein GCM10027275_52050 [Rhabdobacter roseus]|uniref:Uncharacterized protein n=1 Tax=Rhabdobacter roseus TaxID=1655419 RepID=A0A840U629_9BACT|nr:hypothetical protein [Rhabdobacter roseus]MBB5287279.1 hypothetical protein [Rhabdobacter roseus]